MTPAIVLAKKKKLAFTLHEYQHEANSPSYGLEATEKLGINPACVFKTLIVSDEKGALVVAVLPVDCTLNLKKMAKAIGTKKVAMAAAKTVERSSGYVLGGVRACPHSKLRYC